MAMNNSTHSLLYSLLDSYFAKQSQENVFTWTAQDMLRADPRFPKRKEPQRDNSREKMLAKIQAFKTSPRFSTHFDYDEYFTEVSNICYAAFNVVFELEKDRLIDRYDKNADRIDKAEGIIWHECFHRFYLAKSIPRNVTDNERAILDRWFKTIEDCLLNRSATCGAGAWKIFRLASPTISDITLRAIFGSHYVKKSYRMTSDDSFEASFVFDNQEPTFHFQFVDSVSDAYRGGNAPILVHRHPLMEEVYTATIRRLFLEIIAAENVKTAVIVGMMLDDRPTLDKVRKVKESDLTNLWQRFKEEIAPPNYQVRYDEWLNAISYLHEIISRTEGMFPEPAHPILCPTFLPVQKTQTQDAFRSAVYDTLEFVSDKTGCLLPLALILSVITLTCKAVACAF